MKRRVLVFVVFFFLLMVNIPASKANDVKEVLRQRLQNSQNEESRLLQEILRLDARLQNAAAEQQKLEQRLLLVQKELDAARAAQAQAENSLAAGRRDFERSLRFFYLHGSSSFLAAACLSENPSDFFIRWELLKYLADYFWGIVRHNLALADMAREKSNLAAAKERQLEEARQAVQANQETILALKKQQEERLDALRRQNSAWSRDLLALEKAWAGALPTLQYLLQALPSLPWQSLRPDAVQLVLGRGEVMATFSQQNIYKTIFAPQKELENIQLILEDGGIKIAGPDFEIQGTLAVYGPSQLLFNPQNVTFSGFLLEPSTWSELLPQEKLILNLPPPYYGLQFQNITLLSGRMLLTLRR
ncbi:MAG: hypothetical protein IMW95_10335 [Moorella humiferrea]|nr:hypothetical protein [Moorella humiferrea]